MLETSRWIFREPFRKLLLAVQPFLSPYFLLRHLFSVSFIAIVVKIVTAVIKLCTYVALKTGFFSFSQESTTLAECLVQI